MKPFGSILARLLGAYLLPTLAMFSVFGWFAYRATEQNFETALGQRLVGIAQATTAQLSPDALAFLQPGDDKSRTARRLRKKLSQMTKLTHAARIFVIDRALASLADTQKGVLIGDRYYHAEADRTELDQAFAGKARSSVLFRGNDGRSYKTGYAPVVDDNGKVIAAIGVEGSAEFFAALQKLRNSLLLYGAAIAGLITLITFLMARRITRPIRALAREAKRIGAGDLGPPVSVTSRGEVGVLAETMNQMRSDLHRRDQELQMMLAGIAHEVRNPLGGIALFAGLLRDEVKEDADQLEMVQRIERELEYLKKVVSEFLEFARKHEPEFTEIDLASFVADVVEVLEAKAQEADVKLNLNLKPCPVRGDQEQLRRVVMNLITNAIQASDSGQSVTVTTETVDADAILRVEDQGCGIAASSLDQIFTPFFTTKQKGTGLGLSLSRKVAETHGGTLSITSEEHQGTEARLRLPRKPNGA